MNKIFEYNFKAISQGEISNMICMRTFVKYDSPNVIKTKLEKTLTLCWFLRSKYSYVLVQVTGWRQYRYYNLYTSQKQSDSTQPEHCNPTYWQSPHIWVCWQKQRNIFRDSNISSNWSWKGCYSILAAFVYVSDSETELPQSPWQ